MFTNKTVIDIVRKTDLRVHQVVGELIPPSNQETRPFDEILEKFAMKEDILRCASSNLF